MSLHFSIEPALIAVQAANLINTHNKLGSMKEAKDVLSTKVDYILELHGNLVLGVVGVDKQSFTFTEIKHLVVHPNWRRKGIAKHLLRRALGLVKTKMVYATIREDNKASLKVFQELGFQQSGEYPTEDHQVILLVRINPQWEKRQKRSSQHWLVGERTS